MCPNLSIVLDHFIYLTDGDKRKERGENKDKYKLKVDRRKQKTVAFDPIFVIYTFGYVQTEPIFWHTLKTNLKHSSVCIFNEAEIIFHCEEFLSPSHCDLANLKW